MITIGIYTKSPDGDVHIGDYKAPVVPREGECVIGFDHYWIVDMVTHIVQAGEVVLMCKQLTDFPDTVPGNV